MSALAWKLHTSKPWPHVEQSSDYSTLTGTHSIGDTVGVACIAISCSEGCCEDGKPPQRALALPCRLRCCAVCWDMQPLRL